MTTTLPVAPGYTPLDAARNLLTVAAAGLLTVFHRDVSAYVPAAAYLVAGIDVTATHLLKGKGGILHRLEAALSGVATTVGQVVHLLPATAPAAVQKDAAEIGAVTGQIAPVIATVFPSAVTGVSTVPSVVVNVHPPTPQPPPATALVPIELGPAAGSDGAAADEPLAAAPT